MNEALKLLEKSLIEEAGITRWLGMGMKARPESGWEKGWRLDSLNGGLSMYSNEGRMRCEVLGKAVLARSIKKGPSFSQTLCCSRVCTL